MESNCIKYHPLMNSKNIIQGDQYRISILTPGLIRLEYSEEGIFEDNCTQVVINRGFEPCEYQVEYRDGDLYIRTSRILLRYNQQEFSSEGLEMTVYGTKSFYNNVWNYGDDYDSLGGTTRCLDEADGEVELEKGILSRNGFTILDDSESIVLESDGTFHPRKHEETDLYFFGYGLDYLLCLKDFYHLCGCTPMLPRYALGNWWSRYYRYTESTYKQLMNQFEQESIPFSVAVLDMDWHLVDIDPKYGSGWTGYTWNKDCFPDPEEFLNWLHQRGMKVTLNVHPAAGIRAHEDMYQEVAKALGIDYEQEIPVEFDCSNPKFMEAYFELVHHKLEDQGVDFWWIDWQQGSHSKVKEYDPLWILNHCHFLDHGRDGKRSLIFSRYAGPGSHRYPIGFSGDTIMSWESLEFQPYFTATASNIGYGWWSHDIGGHMLGYKDNELSLRWYQFGVFSPIMRLHSSCNRFNGKEPWKFNIETRYIMDRFLQLRHQLIPYLYTMNYRSYMGEPLIQPMYYRYPEEYMAYEVGNQYLFGSELIVAPITCHTNDESHLADQLVWLPEGMYFDFFTNYAYCGGRKLNVYRPLDTIPVFAKAGAIIPMTNEIYGQEFLQNPTDLAIKVFPGADNQFVLYEDDNETNGYLDGQYVQTLLEWNWSMEQSFVIHHPEGNTGLLPENRSYSVSFIHVNPCTALVYVNDEKIEVIQSYDTDSQSLVVQLPSGLNDYRIAFTEQVTIAKNSVIDVASELLERAEIDICLKDQLYNTIASGKSTGSIVSDILAVDMCADFVKALVEILCADS